jgi:hypothetical protein
MDWNEYQRLKDQQAKDRADAEAARVAAEREAERRAAAERVGQGRLVPPLGETPPSAVTSPVGVPSGQPGRDPHARTWLQTGADWLGTQATQIGTGLAGLPGSLYELFIGQGSLEPGTPEYEKFVKYHGYAPKSAKLPQTNIWGTDVSVLPTPKELDKLAFSKLPITETHLPGGVGKTIEAALQSLGIGGAVSRAGRTLPGMIGNVAGGGVGEGAGQTAEWLGLNQKMADAARLLGGVGGTTAAAVPSVVRTVPTKMAARRFEGLTDAEINEGIRRQAEARNMGIWLSPGEALPQGVNAPWLGLEGDIAASPAGLAIKRAENERLAAIRDVHGNLMNRTAPPIDDPKAVDRAISRGATEHVADVRGQRSAAADAAYEKGKQAFVPQDKVKDIVDRIDAELNAPTMDPKSQAAGKLRELRERLAHERTLPGGTKSTWYSTNIGALDRTLDDFEDIIRARTFVDQSGKLVDQSNVTHATRTTVQPFLRDVRRHMVEASPDYAEGYHHYHADPTGRVHPRTTAVTEATESGVGTIAEQAPPGSSPKSGRKAYQDWLTDPDNATPQTIRADLARLPPETRQLALRQYLEGEFDSAFGVTKGQPEGSTTAGADYAKRVAGTPRQAENLFAIADASMADKTAAQGLRVFMDVVKRTGQRPGTGSPTHTRGGSSREASQPGGVIEAATDVATVATKAKVNEAKAGWRERRNFGELATIITQPNNLELLRELALLNPASERAHAITNILLSGGITAQRQQHEAPP